MRGSDKLSRRAIARRPSWLCGQRHDREPQWLRGRGGTATGVRHCERETTKDMVVRYSPAGRADKGFDAADFVVQNTTNRLSAGDTPTRHCGYEISQQKRKRVKLIPLMSSGWHAPPPIGAMPDLRATGPLSAEMLHWGAWTGSCSRRRS
jgi:hypothetical protein